MSTFVLTMFWLSVFAGFVTMIEMIVTETYPRARKPAGIGSDVANFLIHAAFALWAGYLYWGPK